jgi:hypothetical protein
MMGTKWNLLFSAHMLQWHSLLPQSIKDCDHLVLVGTKNCKVHSQFTSWGWMIVQNYRVQ